MRALDELLVKIRPGPSRNASNEAGNHPHPDGGRLVSHLRQAVFQADRAGAWIFLNPGWEALTGFNVSETVGTPLVDYVHPDDRERCQAFLGSLIGGASGDETTLTLRWLHKDGHPLWIELTANAIAGQHRSTLAEGMVGTLRDVTRRVKKEQLQRASNRALKNLFNNLPGMVYHCRNDESWTMEYVSAGSMELTGYRPKDLIENTALSYTNLLHVADRQRVWNEVQSALRNNRPFDLEYRIVTARDEEKWVWERGKGIYSTSGDLLALDGYITDITEKKRIQDRLQQELLYDPATGLPHPTLFMDRLGVAIKRSNARNGYFFILILLELDRVDSLRAKYGPALLERVAVEISRRLLEVLDPVATLSRMRDYRFGILLEQTHNIKDINKAVQQIQECILLPFAIDHSEIYATASIGVTLSSTGYEHGDDALADAHNALSRAQALGGGRHEVFDLHLHARAAAQSKLETELAEAVQNDELCVYWQPIVSLDREEIAGLEAKLVWRHPRRGLLFAERFVPGAEDSQVIIPLWEWMLKAVCDQMELWADLAITKNIGFNVQISGNSLLDADAVVRLGQHLPSDKLRSSRLALGVPAEVLSQAPSIIQELMDRLQSKNIRLVLNAVGAGQAPLSVFRKMPVDMIKLDRSLIANCGQDGRFIGAVAKLAHELGIGVIADYVETEQQLDALRNLGVDYVQGEFISPPLDQAALTSLFETSSESGSKFNRFSDQLTHGLFDSVR